MENEICCELYGNEIYFKIYELKFTLDLIKLKSPVRFVELKFIVFCMEIRFKMSLMKLKFTVSRMEVKFTYQVVILISWIVYKDAAYSSNCEVGRQWPYQRKSVECDTPYINELQDKAMCKICIVYLPCQRQDLQLHSVS